MHSHYNRSFNSFFVLLLSLLLPHVALGLCSAQTISQQQIGIFQTPEPLFSFPTLAAPPKQVAANVQKYRLIARYSHNNQAFTQGLVFYQNQLYESTGLYGASGVRKIDLKTGQTLDKFTLEPAYFGEGLTIFNQRLIQLTWKNQIGFIYKINPLQRIGSFSFNGEGWGATTDHRHLVISNGSSFLQFLSADRRVQRIIQVKDQNAAISGLNELEYAQQAIYANVWPTNCIAKIDPKTGAVIAWLDLSDLAAKNNLIPNSLLNGIAYNPQTGHFFITGKYWPFLYEMVIQ